MFKSVVTKLLQLSDLYIHHNRRHESQHSSYCLLGYVKPICQHSPSVAARESNRAHVLCRQFVALSQTLLALLLGQEDPQFCSCLSKLAIPHVTCQTFHLLLSSLLRCACAEGTGSSGHSNLAGTRSNEATTEYISVFLFNIHGSRRYQLIRADTNIIRAIQAHTDKLGRTNRKSPTTPSLRTIS